jgi:hypothetical protein
MVPRQGHGSFDHLTANETTNGLSVMAGHNIRLTANADLGTGCLGGVDGVFVWRYRLVL